ncbi:hypothetical protein [Nocardioides sp.]|uniref:hypothetical protein n=1 Tax=Nocardioides sp. TaxID=35761 RepID=UPI002602A5F6|nr:hypothetical protein [Nocardioides sp.]MCW2738882.1 hypothetical protein [Nocardioides sp.]
MNHTTQKRSLLAAGDISGLIGLNHGIYGDMQMMARGYSGRADVLRTADGRDLRELFAELEQVASISNESQQRFVDLFTFPVTSAVTSVLQTLGAGPTFEDASEYGVPTSNRAQHSTLNMGVPFKWFDVAWRSTWQYLADATESEIAANAAAIVAADRDNVFGKVMGTVFRNTNRSVTDKKSGQVFDVLAFANGDGWVPPAYEGNTFPGTHTHYRTSGAATVNSADLDEIVTDFKSHGYAKENGSQIVIFVNAVEGDVINGFRVATGAKADFIPSQGQSFFATDGDLIGQQASATFAGFPVKGSYDEAIVIESTRIPAGYVTALASGGSLASSNPIMFRQHRSPTLRGLRIVGGNKDDYPLQDSYWVRGFGTGVRHRLAGMVMQISASGSYTAPTLYTT